MTVVLCFKEIIYSKNNEIEMAVLFGVMMG